LRKSSSFLRVRRRALVVALAITGPIALAPDPLLAEGLFDFFLGAAKQQRIVQPASFFADPLPNAQPPARVASSGPAFCVRTCDGKYFPLTRASGSPVAMCQSFCPASPTRVYFGSSIEGATSQGGGRYADSENAYAFRKALRADCTCNGRDPAGLAAIDLTLDTSLRPGDVIATTNGLVAFSGVRVGNDQIAEFTPVASYPGLTAEVRTRLGEMKVTPLRDELTTGSLPASLINPNIAPVNATGGLKSTSSRDKRADAH
jgi:uncharacterized protein DUF2865